MLACIQTSRPTAEKQRTIRGCAGSPMETGKFVWAENSKGEVVERELLSERLGELLQDQGFGVVGQLVEKTPLYVSLQNKIILQLWYKKKRKKKKVCPWRISLSAVYSFKTKFTEWRPNDGTTLSLSSNLDNNFPVNSSIKCLPISAAKDIQLIRSKQLPVISSEVRKKHYPG